MKPSSSFGRRPRERSESQSSEASQPGELKPSSSFGRKKDSKLSKISRSLSWNTRKKREGGGPAEAIEALGEAGGDLGEESVTREISLAERTAARGLEVDGGALAAATHGESHPHRTWSFGRRQKRNKDLAEAAAPEGSTRVYFLDGSHKLFDIAPEMRLEPPRVGVDQSPERLDPQTVQPFGGGWTDARELANRQGGQKTLLLPGQHLEDPHRFAGTRRDLREVLARDGGGNAQRLGSRERVHPRRFRTEARQRGARLVVRAVRGVRHQHAAVEPAELHGADAQALPQLARLKDVLGGHEFRAARAVEEAKHVGER